MPTREQGFPDLDDRGAHGARASKQVLADLVVAGFIGELEGGDFLTTLGVNGLHRTRQLESRGAIDGLFTDVV